MTAPWCCYDLMLDETPDVVDESDPAHSAGFSHVPVMLDEVVDALGLVPAGAVLDATLGGAGHSTAVLEAHKHLTVVGIDRDDDALAASRDRLARYGERASVHKARFDQLGQVLDSVGVDRISGFLFDLGVSSHQLDSGGRGFSFRRDGPLDMRMDRGDSLSAYEVVNQYDHGSLASVIRRFGDERFSGRIASRIIDSRPIDSTARLAEIVVDAIPAATRRKGGHPAKRTFQAIRIEVNSELDILRSSLDEAVARLAVDGVGLILTYHSGEDRIAKDVIRTRTADDVPRDLPVPQAEPVFTPGRPMRPANEEIERNRRAASARLRSIRRHREDDT